MISCKVRLIFSRCDKQFVQLGLPKHAAQGGLRNKRSRFQVVFHPNHGRLWIDHAEVDDCVDGYRHVIARHDFLASDVDGYYAKIHFHHPVDDGNEKD